jgi:hypothetical protein
MRLIVSEYWQQFAFNLLVVHCHLLHAFADVARIFDFDNVSCAAEPPYNLEARPFSGNARVNSQAVVVSPHTQDPIGNGDQVPRCGAS